MLPLVKPLGGGERSGGVACVGRVATREKADGALRAKDVCSCWATVNTPRPAGVYEQTTRERWHQVHDLLGKGVGLLECARRLNLALNTARRLGILGHHSGGTPA